MVGSPLCQRGLVQRRSAGSSRNAGFPCLGCRHTAQPPLFAIYPHRQRYGESVCALGIQHCAERTAGSVHALKACITRAPAQNAQPQSTCGASLGCTKSGATTARCTTAGVRHLTAEKSHKLPAEGEHTRPRRHEQDRLRSQRCRNTHADCPEVDRVHVHLTADNQLSRLQPH